MSDILKDVMSLLLQHEPREWSEFFDLTKFKAPRVGILEERVATNMVYFKGNYILTEITNLAKKQ